MIGAIINIVIGLGLIIAGLSGEFVIRGTNSSELLALLGAVVLIFGIVGVARRIRANQ